MKAFLFCLICLFIPALFKKEFKLPPTRARFPANQRWECEAPNEKIKQILRGPFTYLAHGNQSTVFLSHDGEYVLKLFRYKRTMFPFVHLLKNWYKTKEKLPLYTKLIKTFNAAYLACHEGQEFTQALFCHLNLTENELPTIYCEVRGKRLPIPLDRHRFVLQKRAEDFKSTLIKARNNPEQMKSLLQSFGDLLINRSLKDIYNTDPNLKPNFGFIDGKAVEIDFGNYQKGKNNLTKHLDELGNFFTRLEHLMGEIAPEYLPTVIDLREITQINMIQKYETIQNSGRFKNSLSRDS